MKIPKSSQTRFYGPCTHQWGETGEERTCDMNVTRDLYGTYIVLYTSAGDKVSGVVRMKPKDAARMGLALLQFSDIANKKVDAFELLKLLDE